MKIFAQLPNLPLLDRGSTDTARCTKCITASVLETRLLKYTKKREFTFFFPGKIKQ